MFRYITLFYSLLIANYSLAFDTYSGKQVAQAFEQQNWQYLQTCSGKQVEQALEQQNWQYLQTCAKTNIDAARILGIVYYNGEGVPQDYKKAREWLEKAAKLKNALATANLSLLYAEGLGVPKDYKKAKELLKQAAKLGYEDVHGQLEKLIQVEKHSHKS